MEESQKILNEMKVSFSRYDAEIEADVYSMDNVIHCAVRPVPIEMPTEVVTEHEGQKESVEHSESETTEDGVVRQRWRFLSAVKAWPHSSYWQPQLVDYTANGGEALKSAIPLINQDKPDLRWDHSDSAKDVAGNIDNAEWEDTSDIVAGINGDVVVDEAFDQKAALGLKKGIIRSGSIGIRAEFIRSHPDMEIEAFVSKQGKTIDGKEVRWIATRIVNVGHMAILPTGEGADPNAGPRTSPIKNSAKSVTRALDHTGSKTPHIKKRGGHNMADVMNHLGEVANLLKVDFSLDEATLMPEQLREATDNILKRITGLLDNHKALLAYQSKIKDLESYVVLEDEQGLKSAEILDRLPAKLEYAKHGEAFLVAQRREAVSWFDKAKVTADADMSENDKRIRGRISNSQDLGFVEEQLNLYKEIAEGRFGPLRSAESAPIEEEKPKPTINHSQDLEDMKAMFGRNGGKE